MLKGVINLFFLHYQIYSFDNWFLYWGWWEQRKQMKFKEPTIEKKIRALFRKNNYKVY
jgi:hypothetical protein